MNDLASKVCVPCRGGVPPLKGEAIVSLQNQLHSDWKVSNEHHLTRAFAFDDFRQALDFTQKIGELAEQEAHHPDICLGWGKLEVTLYTHKVDGLTESDFILAAKIDHLN